MDIETYLKDKKKLIEDALDRLLPPVNERPEKIHESMRYSVFAGGKRLRPILCLAALESLDGEPVPSLPAACALELVHTYSLIHDDLPCMDDDDLRRGKPTNHRVFGEAVALLAGNALLARAFELVANIRTVDASLLVELSRALAQSSGAAGLIGGQALDLASEGKEVSEETLEYIHAHKTAALIETSVLFGAILGLANAGRKEALSTYGRCLGMAFQITDDILDVTGDEARMGKRARQDEKARKVTYPAFHGMEESCEIAGRYIDRALVALESFGGRAEPLREIARTIVSRKQ